jgi:flagellar basal body-associated protein FliL
MEYLLGIIAALVGGLVFFRNKAKTAEALNENLKTNKQVTQESIRIEALRSDVEAEKAARNAIQSGIQESVKKDATAEELVDFVNSRNKR